MKKRLLRATRTKPVELSGTRELQQLITALRRSAKGSTVYKATLDKIHCLRSLLDQLPTGELKECHRADFDKVVKRIESLQETKLVKTKRKKLPVKERTYFIKKE